MVSCSPSHTPVPFRAHHGIGHAAPSHPVYHPVRPVHHPVRAHQHHPPQYGPPAPKPPPKPAPGCQRAPADGGLKDGAAAHAGGGPGGGTAAAQGGTFAAGAGAAGGAAAAGAGAVAPGAVAGAFLLAAGSLGLAASLGGVLTARGALLAAVSRPAIEGSGAAVPGLPFAYLVCSPGARASAADAAEAYCLVTGPDVAAGMAARTGQARSPVDQVTDTPHTELAAAIAQPDVAPGTPETGAARAVPEPGTLLILATGALAALGIRSLRRGAGKHPRLP